MVNGLIWSLYGLLALLFLSGWHLLRGLPEPPPARADAPIECEWPRAAVDAAAIPDSVFAALSGAGAQQVGSRSELPYRLAGTFLKYGSPDHNRDRQRKAIIDDIERRRQALLEEGESYRDIGVLRISRDHILVERDGRQHELWLSFDDSSAADETGQGAGDEAAVRDLDSGAGNRFGRRVGESKWVFSKQALRDFYAEMLDDPARAVDIYETMRPDYDDERNIQGYVVDIVGEKGFFDAVGLRNGDVVRKVNSMEMRSRNRAEYFIREFMKDRVGAVVLDIERDGEERKQIYMLR